MFIKGQVAAIDFQMFGYGLVSFEFVYLLFISFNAKNFSEIEEIIRGMYTIYYLIKSVNSFMCHFCRISFGTDKKWSERLQIG